MAGSGGCQAAKKPYICGSPMAMFSSDLKVRKYGLLLGKALIGAGTFYLLFRVVFNEGPGAEAWLSRLWAAFRQGAGGPILLALGLIPLNWGLEALKWQGLSRKVERISLVQAYRAVLVGICLGFITPNRLGDYAGRILELRSRQRLEAVGAVFLGRFCQLLITLTAGSGGVVYFAAHIQALAVPAGILPGLVIGLVALNLGAYLVLFNPRIILAMVAAMPFLNRFIAYLSVIGRYKRGELGLLLTWSALRYLVFMSQFLLLLKAFGVKPGWLPMAMGVASTYLVKSVLPSFNAFTDLGMRELSAMYFFALLGQDKALVMSASLSLWFLNIAVPSVAGLLLVWRIKLKHLGQKRGRKIAG
jgi:Lysylphosphatidylglycerol synthase TM region